MKQIRYETLRVAIHDQMLRPVHTFADVIHKHFTLKRQTILQQLEEWGETYSRTMYFVSEIRKLLESKFAHPLPPSVSEAPTSSSSLLPRPKRGIEEVEFEDYSHLLYDTAVEVKPSNAKKVKSVSNTSTEIIDLT